MLSAQTLEVFKNNLLEQMRQYLINDDKQALETTIITTLRTFESTVRSDHNFRSAGRKLNSCLPNEIEINWQEKIEDKKIFETIFKKSLESAFKRSFDRDHEK